MLQSNQIGLLEFMAKYPCLDYESCLRRLGTYENDDMVALSYAFRPLTRYGYLSKGKDGFVTLTAKGRRVVDYIEPLVSVGSGSTRERVAKVARMAMRLDDICIPSREEIQKYAMDYFIPSACWRRIVPGILSTTRFLGMLILDEKAYAVYDIGDGHMEWQMRAESSLYNLRNSDVINGLYTVPKGMIFVCNDDARTAVAENIIRQTMWYRKQLLQEYYSQRDKPARWSRSPIKLRRQYEHVYLTTPTMLGEDLDYIIRVDEFMKLHEAQYGKRMNNPTSGDYENWPKRYFDNPATDLLKYVYFFARVKDDIRNNKEEKTHRNVITYGILYRPKDQPILNIYSDMLKSVDWVEYYEYSDSEDDFFY